MNPTENFEMQRKFRTVAHIYGSNFSAVIQSEFNFKFLLRKTHRMPPCSPCSKPKYWTRNRAVEKYFWELKLRFPDFSWGEQQKQIEQYWGDAKSLVSISASGQKQKSMVEIYGVKIAVSIFFGVNIVEINILWRTNCSFNILWCKKCGFNILWFKIVEINILWR